MGWAARPPQGEAMGLARLCLLLSTLGALGLGGGCDGSVYPSGDSGADADGDADGDGDEDGDPCAGECLTLGERRCSGAILESCTEAASGGLCLGG